MTAPGGSGERRGEPSEPQVGRVFRDLFDEHIEARRDDPAALWQRLAARQRPGLVLLGPPRRGVRLPLWAWVPALGAGLCGLVIAFWSHSELGFEVVGGTESGGLVATEDTAASVLFNEQSRVDLAPHTTVRVNIEGKQRVVSRLGQGELDVRVVHRAETDYRFWAGPYEVMVVGTAFRLSFEPRQEHMELSLHEGRVRIFDAQRREVVVQAGQTVSFEHGAKLEEPAKPAAASLADAAPPAEPAQLAPVAASGESAAPPAGTRPSYASLAQAGRFSEIVRDAEHLGLDRVLYEKSGAELQELAQAAHYTGRGELAQRTWKALRTRFAGQAVGINAAFFLGRQSDQSGRRAEALAYFDAYLQKAPRGTYAAEALGRKLLLVDRTKAHDLAVEYLKRFPRGPYAENARQLIRSE